MMEVQPMRLDMYQIIECIQYKIVWNTFQKNENNLTLHYHNYDRQYENSGYLDEYYSESLVIKGESKKRFSKKISFGYGSEYKYDWGEFENRGSYNASTKGHMSNLGVFGNIGYKFNKNSILSIYGRSDDHNTTGGIKLIN